MRTAVVVTLIVVGALLIITPVVADLFHEANLVRLFQEPSAANRTFTGEGISETYSLGCWFTGTIMIAVSILLAAWFSRQAR
jgi:hypothetical protein